MLLVLAPVLAACTGASAPSASDAAAPSGTASPLTAPVASASEPGEPMPSGTPTSSPDEQEVTVEEARTRVAAARLEDGESLDALADLIGTETGAAAAAEALAGDVEGDALWAATYVYAASGADPGPLRTLAEHSDASIRVLAAGGLISMGDASGFDLLVAELTNEQLMAGAHGATPIAHVAAQMLVAGTGNAELIPDPEAGTDGLAALRSAWTGWLADNRDRLTYDPVSRAWTIG